VRLGLGGRKIGQLQELAEVKKQNVDSLGRDCTGQFRSGQIGLLVSRRLEDRYWSMFEFGQFVV